MNEFKLIEGEFKASDAKEVLSSILDDKITFHYKRIFSHEERFGTKDNHSVERVKALKENKLKILDLLSQAENEGKTVQLNSSIVIA